MNFGRLSSAEALIAAVATFVTLVLSYTSITGVLNLPDNVGGLAGFLSIPALIGLVLLLLLATDAVEQHRYLSFTAVLVFLALGISAAFGSEFLINEYAHQTDECRDAQSTYILAPFEPSQRLQDLIMDTGAGSINLAWCSEDPVLFREELLREANKSVLILSLLIFSSQVLLTYGIIVAAWLVAKKK